MFMYNLTIEKASNYTGTRLETYCDLRKKNVEFSDTFSANGETA